MIELFYPYFRGRALLAVTATFLIMPVIWLFGPLINWHGYSPLETELNRALFCLALFILCLVGIWVFDRMRKDRDKKLVEGMTGAEAGAERAAEEEAELRDKLATALTQLRQAAGKKGNFLYEQPWYVFIGPPGSGKTTAIRYSGLEFPFAEGAVLQGVGGTRFCEWMLTDRAVLIDTAGRYTTQDSDAAADKAGWDRLMGLIKKNRPRLPLNGVVVCFGVDMISRLSGPEREAHARSVRRRIRELEKALGQRLPIYFLVSKADLLPGFSEFFDDLDRDTRQQVWGFTFPLVKEPEGAVGRFGVEFDLLEQRLQDRMIERLQQERGPAQRAAMAGFPPQFASLQEPLGAFITAAFGGTKLDPAPLLRGVYFTSGTQEGSPLDRLAGALTRAFGLDPRRPAALMAQKGKSFFLGRLLRDVIFNEARLAAGNRGMERRRRIIAACVWVFAIAAVAGGAAYAWHTQATEQARMARLADQIAKAEQAARGLPLDRVADDEMTRILPYLAAARDLAAAARGEGPGLGLSQEEKLLAGAETAYRRALDRSFLPRLLYRLEGQIQGSFQRPDYLYEATRIYLMLGRQGPVDAPLLRRWFVLDWGRAYPGATAQPTRTALLQHLDALLAQDFPEYPVNGALVDRARIVFSRLPLADRVMSRLRPMADNAQNAQPWRPSEVLGPAGSRYFVRASGQPLTEGIPGLFTVEGLYRIVLPTLPNAVRDAVGESWVLGPQIRNVPGGDDPAQLERAVLTLYANEYVAAWDRMLQDLNIQPLPRNPAQAAEALNLLGAPNSPLREILRSIARQLSPGTNPDARPAQPAQQGGAQQRVEQAQGPEPSSAEPVAQIVEPRFQRLRDVPGQPLEGTLVIINDLYVQLARQAAAGSGTAIPAPAGLNPIQRLRAEAQRQPDPFGRWLATLAQDAGGTSDEANRQAIAAAGAAELAPRCRPMETRFPIRRDGQDPPIDDFRRFFGPGGTMDTFFTTRVRQFVDTTTTPWRPMAPETGNRPVVSAADVMQFWRASAIRDAFFPGVGAGGLRFELLPLGGDPALQGVVLEAEGLRTEIDRNGPFRPITLTWPTNTNTTLTFDPPASTGPITYDGPWSSLRLVMRRENTLQATQQRERLRLTVRAGDRSIVFELRAGSASHPFGLRELEEFRCPLLAP